GRRRTVLERCLPRCLRHSRWRRGPLSFHDRWPPAGFTALEEGRDAAPPVMAELSESPRAPVRLTGLNRREPTAHRAWCRSFSLVGTIGSADDTAGLQSTRSLRRLQGIRPQ